MRSLLSLVICLFVAVASALSSAGGRLLVILDDVADKAGYSKFLGDLEGRGFSITYETPKSESLSLFNLGEKAFDHVLIFPVKSKGLGPNLTPNILLQYINEGGNILLTLSSEIAVPTSLISVLSELDITLPADRTGLVVDHFSYDTASAADKHDVVLLPAPSALRSDVADFFGAGVAKDGQVIAFPRGLGHILGNGELLTPILRAGRTAYSYNPKEQAEAVDSSDLFAAGQQLALASAMQARNSARFVVVGSAEMLQDAWFDAKVKPSSGAGKEKEIGTANREFAKRLSGWTFQEIGVLKVNWVEHHLNEPGATNESNPKIYRVKNDVTYTASLSEWSWDAWKPFLVSGNDELQLEFSMLSPFWRIKLTHDAARSTGSEAVYTASFKLPDQHGIFNFMLDYKRPLLTYLVDKNTVSVRHMAHDEWPRSYVISGAWPWIAGIAVTISGWFVFCLIWVYSAPVKGATAVKKTQ